MRKYQITSSNGEIYTMSHIGVNHTANGLFIGGNISSYNKEFDNEDEVCLESGLDDIRYCKIGDIRETYKILKEEILSKRPHNVEDYSECVQRTINRYFGDFSKVKTRLSYYPCEDDNKEIGKVSDLAHKNAAMCVERAMVAQNLLMEIGIKSTFKMSGVIINGNVDAHAYNIISHDGKYYIFDVTIPTIRNDRLSPLICEIPKEVYDKIIKPNQDIGISVEVSHYNPLQKKDYNIIYDAGRKDIYEKESYTK